MKKHDRFRCDNTIEGPPLSGLTSSEVIKNAKFEKQERKRILDYSSEFASEWAARNYLQLKDFEDIDGVWHNHNHRARISRCKDSINCHTPRDAKVSPRPSYFVSYWLESEEKKSRIEPKARPNCWVTEW